MRSGHPITAIFFDLGFTLIQFDGDFFRAMEESHLALAKSLIKSGCWFEAQSYAERFGEVISGYYRSREIDLIERPVKGYLAQVLEEFGHSGVPSRVIRTALTEMYTVTESYWKIDPDAHQTLERLQGEGYAMGLITNAADAEDANRLVDKFSLRPYFGKIIISAEEKIRKPDPRIFKRALRRVGVPARNTAMVGDSLVADIGGAQKAGLFGIWLERRAKPRENLATSGVSIAPDATITRLPQLFEVLQTLK